MPNNNINEVLKYKGLYAFINKEDLVLELDEYLDEDFDNIKDYNPNLLKIINTFKDKESINPHAINPDYLKLTEAEESKMN